MKVRLVSLANNELEEAIHFYEHQLPGLGFRFFQEAKASIDRIRSMPEAWPEVGERTRRCLLKGFPYALLYVVETDEILVTAVAHLHRDPDHYRGRIA